MLTRFVLTTSKMCFLSSHDQISVTYKIKVERHIRRTVCARDFRSFDIRNFSRELESYDWNSLLNAQDVNDKTAMLCNFLTDCFDNHAPLREFSPKHLPAPWLSKEIKAMMRERDRARRVWRRRKNTDNHNIYRALRNQAQAAVRTAKREYYHKAFIDNNNPNEI